MKKLLLIVLILNTLLLCSCYNISSYDDISENSSETYEDDISEDNPLKIYILVWDNFERYAIEKYNNSILAGQIDGRKIEVTEFEIDEYEEMYDRILNEIMAGEGPDIIFINDLFNVNNDFIKMSDQDAFADLDVLANSSETFSYADYNKSVMDAGIINNKRTLMPISYSVPYAFSTEEVFAENNIQIPDRLTFENLLDSIVEFENNNAMKYYGVIDYIWCDILSPDSSTLDLDSDILKKYLMRLQELYISNNNEIVMDNIPTGVFEANDLIYTGYFKYNTNQFNLFVGEYNQINNAYKNNVLFMGMPCDAHGNSMARVEKSIAININSKYKNDAFKFGEYLMSYDLAVDTIQYNDISLPVNIRAYEQFKAKFPTETINIYDVENSTVSKPVPPDIAAKCIEIIERPTVCVFTGQAEYIRYNIIQDILNKFYNQEIDYDTLIKQIDSKLELYKSE